MQAATLRKDIPEKRVLAEKAKSEETFKCDVCNLNLTTKDQLTIHLSGKKHLKKLNFSGAGTSSAVTVTRLN